MLKRNQLKIRDVQASSFQLLTKTSLMTFRPFRVICLIFLFLLHAPGVSAQSTDLRQDKAFFQKKKADFAFWLRQNKLERLFRVDSVGVAAQKVTLFLRPAYTGKNTCDSLQCVWNQLEKANRKVNGQYFHERLLHKWAFLAEVHEEQAEVVVRCHAPAHFQAKISSKNGKIPVETLTPRSGVLLDVRLPASLQGINNGDNLGLIPGKKLSAVCNTARQFLIKFYRPKGTPILWKAKVDTSYYAYDEFIVEATHLSNEICPDGYFEYHRIYIKAVQKGEDVEISWEFQGKYGSGIIFPPRKNDYKDMEQDYKTSLDEYQKHLFKQLTDYLRR